MALSRKARPSETQFDTIQMHVSRLNNIVWFGSAQHLTEIEQQVASIKNSLDILVEVFQEEHADQFPPKELPDSKMMNQQDRDIIEELPDVMN